MTVVFLDIDDVLEIHELQLAEFGGMAGLRDRGLLESAVAQPMASAFGQFLHTDVVHMAAAYLFHLASNHAFIDGNKRTALVAAIVFLELNGYVLPDGAPELYDLTLGVANGTIPKDRVTDTLRRLVKPQAVDLG